MAKRFRVMVVSINDAVQAVGVYDCDGIADAFSMWSACNNIGLHSYVVDFKTKKQLRYAADFMRPAVEIDAHKLDKYLAESGYIERLRKKRRTPRKRLMPNA